jgi:hypothetical protein
MAVVGYDNLVTELGYTGSVTLSGGDMEVGSIVVEDPATGEFALASAGIDGSARVAITLEKREGQPAGTVVPVAWGGVFKKGNVVQGGANIDDPLQAVELQKLGFIFR